MGSIDEWISTFLLEIREGIIKNYFLSSERWVYLVEMELGSLPNLGIFGFETPILLHQTALEPAIA